MKTLGVDVSQEQIDAAINRMRKGPFLARNIEDALVEAGLRDSNRCPVVMRTADKLLQRERRAGRIKFLDGRWLPQ